MRVMMSKRVCGNKVRVNRPLCFLIVSMLMMWLHLPASYGTPVHDLSVVVSPNKNHPVPLPALDGSLPVIFNLSITTDTNKWRIVSIDTLSEADGWNGSGGFYSYTYDPTTPEMVYKHAKINGELEPVDPPKGRGGKVKMTFTVETEGDPIQTEYRIRPPEDQTVCAGNAATFYAEKKVGAADWELAPSFWTVLGTTSTDPLSSTNILITTPDVYPISAKSSTRAALTASATLTIIKVELELVLLDEEPDTDPRVAVRDASGLDMSTLSVTLNGNTVASSIMTITDITSGSLVVGKKLQFTAPCSMLNLPGNNEIKANVSDNAGNAMDEVTQSFILP